MLNLIKALAKAWWLPLCLLMLVWKPIAWVPPFLTVLVLIIALLQAIVFYAIGRLAASPAGAAAAKLLSLRGSGGLGQRLTYCLFAFATMFLILKVGYVPLAVAFTLQAGLYLLVEWRISNFAASVLKANVLSKP